MNNAVDAVMDREKYAAFGEIEALPLSKVQRLTGAYLSRNWSSIPHVTHNDDADVTALEATRKALAQKHPARPITYLAFLVRATAMALKLHPSFNSSLDESGQFIILKKYFNVGIAVDTPRGLVVPVIKGADRLTISEIALDIEQLSAKARGKGLSMQDMSGGCFTISSLGRDGGTSFTPIINAPEVGILGVSRLFDKPVPVSHGLAWRKALPLSLSYDHRVINGVQAARFMGSLIGMLQQPAETWFGALQDRC